MSVNLDFYVVDIETISKREFYRLTRLSKYS